MNKSLEIIKSSKGNELKNFVDDTKPVEAQLAILCEICRIPQPSTRASEFIAMEVIDTYGHFGINEVVHAFRLAARNVLGVSLNTYQAPLDITLIHEVMTAYRSYRKDLERKLRSEQKRQAELEKKYIPCPEEYRSTFEPIKVQDPKQAAQEGKAKVNQLRNELNK